MIFPKSSAIAEKRRVLEERAGAGARPYTRMTLAAGGSGTLESAGDAFDSGEDHFDSNSPDEQGIGSHQDGEIGAYQRFALGFEMRNDPVGQADDDEIERHDGGDLEHVEGFWQLYELSSSQTLGRFGTRVQVGTALPVWLQDYATRQNVPQTMEHVRRWVDSGGTYRP